MSPAIALSLILSYGPSARFRGKGGEQITELRHGDCESYRHPLTLRSIRHVETGRRLRALIARTVLGRRTPRVPNRVLSVHQGSMFRIRPASADAGPSHTPPVHEDMTRGRRECPELLVC